MKNEILNKGVDKAEKSYNKMLTITCISVLIAMISILVNAHQHRINKATNSQILQRDSVIAENKSLINDLTYNIYILSK